MLDALEDILAGDHEDHFLHAPKVRWAGIHRLDLPVTILGIAAVHAQQVCSKERALGSARAGPNFQNGVTGICGVRRDNTPLNRRREM